MRILTFDQLKPVKGIPYSRTQLWRRAKDGTFPRPIRLSAQRTGWVEDEIDAWLEDLAAAREPAAA